MERYVDAGARYFMAQAVITIISLITTVGSSRASTA